MFGAITSKPKKEAQAELIPELQGKGLTYRSPIVRLTPAPQLILQSATLQSLSWQSAQLSRMILTWWFSGKMPKGCTAVWNSIRWKMNLREMMKKYAPALGNFDDVDGNDMAMTIRVVTMRGADRIIRRAFEYAQKHGYPTVTLVEKPNVLRETSGMMVRVAREIHEEFPGDRTLGDQY